MAIGEEARVAGAGYRRCLLRKEHRTAYWMAAPALVAILAIIVYPLAFATYYSLREVRTDLVGEFVVFSSYTKILQRG